MSDPNNGEKSQRTERERIVGRMQQEEAIQREYGTGSRAKNGSSETAAAPGTGVRKPWRSAQVWKGIGLVALLHLMLIFVPAAYIILGLIQWVYVIPVLLMNRQDPGLFQGILIAAGVTFLLNAAWLAVLFGM